MTGRSQLEAEIDPVKAIAKRRLARLHEKQRRDRVRHDSAVLEILRGRINPEAMVKIEAEARAQLDAQAAERSRRARDAAQRRNSAAATPDTVAKQHEVSS